MFGEQIVKLKRGSMCEIQYPKGISVIVDYLGFQYDRVFLLW